MKGGDCMNAVISLLMDKIGKKSLIVNSSDVARCREEWDGPDTKVWLERKGK